MTDNKTHSANTREISKEHWVISFENWLQKVTIDISGENTIADKACGYCIDARRIAGMSRDTRCSFCIINEKICGNYGGTGYFMKWRHAKTKKTKLKYSMLILSYIVSEGRRLSYITPEQEIVAREVMNEA